MIPPGAALGNVRVALPGAPVVGLVDPAGRLVNLGDLAGWWDPPPTTGVSTQKVNDHGAWLGPAYYGPRVITLEARIDGFSPGDSLATAQRLMNALTLDQLTTLSVTDENETLTAQVRQEGDPLLARSGNRVVVSLSMMAPDPRRYFPASAVTVGLPVSAGGVSLPISLPLSLNASSGDGTANIFNAGDMEGSLVFTVFGPCPAFTITDAAGRQLAYADAIASGRSLVLDVSARRALLDGTANRVVTGTWPRLMPGANTFAFRAATYDAGALMSVTYRSARR